PNQFFYPWFNLPVDGRYCASSQVAGYYLKGRATILRCNRLRRDRSEILKKLRDLSRPRSNKRQHAIQEAMLFPDPEKGGRGKKEKPSEFSDGLGITTDHAKNLLSDARAVLRYSRNRDLKKGPEGYGASNVVAELKVVASKERG